MIFKYQNFELNVDEFINTYWEHKITDDVSVISRRDNSWGTDRKDHPIAQVKCSSLHSGCTAEEALAYGQALVEAAMVVKTIEAQYQLISARYDFQQAKREMRRERRALTPTPKREMPRVTKERVMALLKEIKDTNNPGDGWKLDSVIVMVRPKGGKFTRSYQIHSWGNKLEVVEKSGWRWRDVTQKALAQDLENRKLGNVKFIRNESKWDEVEQKRVERDFEMKLSRAAK